MILSDILGGEDHDTYQTLALQNLVRQYDFLHSIIAAAISVNVDPKVSSTILKALNHHAIACLHLWAGEYRPHDVTVGDHLPPGHAEVPALVDDFLEVVNSKWNDVDAVALAAYSLWQLNYIHPFVNGNGRTARALCYYVVCVKLGGEPSGDLILPERIRQHRDEYVALLQRADLDQNLIPLQEFLQRLLLEQLHESQ